jgi:hypothetical protein
MFWDSRFDGSRTSLRLESEYVLAARAEEIGEVASARPLHSHHHGHVEVRSGFQCDWPSVGEIREDLGSFARGEGQRSQLNGTFKKSTLRRDPVKCSFIGKRQIEDAGVGAVDKP